MTPNAAKVWYRNVCQEWKESVSSCSNWIENYSPDDEVVNVLPLDETG